MKKKFLNSKGYTLVEMLAVIVVFAIIGGIIASIFASSLRGTNKANITNDVRQNGNYALVQMSRMITYAQSFDGISIDGVEYITDCYIDSVGSGTPTPTPAEYHYLKISNFEGGQTIFNCNTTDSEITPEIASNSAALINTELVRVDSCTFSCAQSSVSQPPTIGISFTLSQRSETSFFEQKATIPFETTVTMRNVGK